MLAEDAQFRHARIAYAEQMKMKGERRKVEDALKESDRKLKKAKHDIRHHEKVLVAMTASRAYTVQMLGEGHKKGGARQHAKRNVFSLLIAAATVLRREAPTAPSIPLKTPSATLSCRKS